MKYRGIIYRPPIEADTFLLPVTEGCTHNSCTFCNMYKDVPFRMIPVKDVEEYLSEVAEKYRTYAKKIQRIYLVGANPFALSAAKLMERAAVIKKYLPNIKVISMYARIDDIARKSDEELAQLKDAGVNDLYLGIESGLDDVLAYYNKGFSVQDTIEQCLRLNRAGIRHEDLLMTGTAGKNRGKEAADAAAKLENIIKPDKILLTTMSAFEGTGLNDDIRAGKFIMASEKECLEEEYQLLKELQLPDTYFWAAHAINSTGTAGMIGEHREQMLSQLQEAIATMDETRNYNRIDRRGTL